MRRRPVLVALVAAYVVALLALVLTPISWVLNRATVKLYVVWHDDLHLGHGVLPETFGTVLNVLLFVPFGAAAVVLLRTSWWRATLLAVAASAAIELVQAIPAVHREATLGDVVANGSGALVGALIAVAVRRRRAA